MKKLDLYHKAKEAYYNGQEIMSDLEFDELEKSLGLSNVGPVGARRNPSYTVKHPVFMGSLRKIQVHDYDWKKYFSQVDLIVNFDRGVIITPKYDGCSFEVLFHHNGKENEIIKASTRGDGEFGKDITPLVKHLFTKYGGVESIPYTPKTESKLWMVRGEILVHKQIFQEKYTEEFSNPRAFVSGTINADWTLEELQGRPSDLDFVVYEYRINDFKDHWKDKDWTILKKLWKGSSLLNKLPQVFDIVVADMDVDRFQGIYKKMDIYRHDGPYALDGIVVKPLDIYRLKTPREYPKDCVAIKFKPQLSETIVDHIEWNIGKTGEYNPVVITAPVLMDGKVIKRASGHNYGYLIKHKVGKGTRLVLSLAGDIIPFIYKVTDTSEFSEEGLNLPKEYQVNGCHLMASLSENSKNKIRFINSATTLNIPTIGESKAEQIWNYLERKGLNFGITNILQLSNRMIYRSLGRGKTGHNGRIAFLEVVEKLSLSEIIQSCNFNSCGKKVAEQVENLWLGLKSDFSHLPSKAYEWAYDYNSPESKEVYLVLNALGKQLSDFHKEESASKIPIIMTGKPKNYKTKAAFLESNPQYTETTSWDNVQIIFTGDLSSTSSKMKKAQSKGIEIRLY